MEPFHHVERPHAVCLPMPSQSHINPMLKLAKLLHSRGCFITFVYTEFDLGRLLRSCGPASLTGSDDFQFQTIPDGLPPPDHDGNRHVPSLCDSLRKNCLAPFRDLLMRLNSEGRRRVSLLVWDGLMSFGRQAAAELGVPDVMFWTASACGLMGYLHYPQLIEKGLAPLKDESCLSNGFLDTRVDWIPGMKDICLSDLPEIFRTTDPDDIMFNFVKDEAQSSLKASAIIFNTLEELEHDVLTAMASVMVMPPTYTIGPISLLCKQIPDTSAISTPSNLWKEDPGCIEWLDQRDPRSVVYVNFGSVINLSIEQLLEFAWGLANSNCFFLWVIRLDLIAGDKAILPREFARETEGRCLVVGWCPQEQVLLHPSVGVFLTHCGWNSILEGICGGVPMICRPVFADQTTNCHYACKKWGIGVELGDEVRREEVESVIREVVEGEKGKEMRQRVMEWKERMEKGVQQGGSSYSKMNQLFDYLTSQVKM